MANSPDIAEVAAMLREFGLSHTVGVRVTEQGIDREFVRCFISGRTICYAQHGERRGGELRIEDPDAGIVRDVLAVVVGHDALVESLGTRADAEEDVHVRR